MHQKVRTSFIPCGIEGDATDSTATPCSNMVACSCWRHVLLWPATDATSASSKHLLPYSLACPQHLRFRAVPSKASSSGERSWSVEGGGKPDLHPLSDAWSINPADLAVCQLPDGRDWILGTGSFGASLAPTPHNGVVLRCHRYHYCVRSRACGKRTPAMQLSALLRTSAMELCPPPKKKDMSPMSAVCHLFQE